MRRSKRLLSYDRQWMPISGRFVVVLGVLIAGCTDTTSPNSIIPQGISAAQVCDPADGACAGGGPGGGINPNDSWVSGDVAITTLVTVSLSAPVYDDATGEMSANFTVTSPDEHLHVDAGYSYGGSTIVNTSYTDGDDPGTTSSIQVANANLVADNLTEINSADQQMGDPNPSDASAASPMQIVGSTQNGDVTAGAMIDLLDTTTVTPSGTSVSSIGVRTNLSSIAIRGSASPNTGHSRNSRSVLANAARDAEKSGAQRVNVDGRLVTVEKTDAVTLRVASQADEDESSSINTQPNALVRHYSIYKRSGSAWELSEVRSEMDGQDARNKVHQAYVMRFTHLRVHRNPVQDAKRSTLRPTTAWIPLQSVSTSGLRSSSVQCAEECVGGYSGNEASHSVQPPPFGRRLPPGNQFKATLTVLCGEECIGGTPPAGGTLPPQPIGVDLGCARDVVGTVSEYGNVNLLYQHGLFSDATTWCSMDPYLRTRFAVHNEIRHSLTSTDYYENQASALEGKIRDDAASYPGPYAFVGHSNGGVVSRLAAQALVSQGNYVNGVVTVSSPQDGAPLAKVGRDALLATQALPFLASKLACSLVAHIVCTTAHLLQGSGTSSLSSILDPIVNQSGNVLSEMTPDNSFYSTLNAGSEPFPRAAVIDQAWDKWTAWRLLGDWSCRLYTECDGRHTVAAVDRAYHRYLDCAVIGGIFSFFIPGAGSVAQVCGLSAANLKGADLVYKRMSVGNDHGDGVVPNHSQRYPNLDESGQFYVYDSDSHLGVTQSTRQTGPQIAQAINQRLHVSIAQ